MSESQREKLLALGITRFARRPVEGPIVMSRFQRESGISDSTFFRIAGSRDRFTQMVREHCWSEVFTYLSREVYGDTERRSPREQLRTELHRVVSVPDDKLEVFTAAFDAFVDGDEGGYAGKEFFDARLIGLVANAYPGADWTLPCDEIKTRLARSLSDRYLSAIPSEREIPMQRHMVDEFLRVISQD